MNKADDNLHQDADRSAGSRCGVHWVKNEMNKKIAGPAESDYCDFGGIS